MSGAAKSAIWVCLLASISLYAQQDTPLPAILDPTAQQQPADEPSPQKINPKTGLPYTPAELREMEIDKYDPMKRNVDPTDDNRLTDRERPKALPTKPVDPLPGSVAAMNADQATPRKPSDVDTTNGAAQDTDEASAAANGAEYTGPAVLSRSYTLARPMVPRQIQWNANLGLGYAWSTGQAPGAANGVTNYQSVGTQSLSYSWSTTGRHVWKRDQVGLSYGGGYSGYSAGNGLSGLNQSLNLDYTHIVSRRLSLNFVESLQDLSQNYSFENPTLQPGNSIANINLSTSPQVQLLNSRTIQSSSGLSVTWRPKTRLSYNLSSNYFIIGRTEGIGMRGQQYSADMNYRWTRKATVGGYYSYTKYLYSHDISTSDSQGVGLIFSYAINRSTQVQTRFGVTRIESLALSAVPLPPALAAILGQSSVIVNAYNLRRTSDVSAQIVRDFRRSRTFSVAWARGQSPGNGVLLTSLQQSFSVGFATTLFRRKLPISIGLSRTSIESTSPGNIGSYRNDTIYLSTSRQIKSGVYSTLSINYLRYNVTGSPLNQDSLRISVGLSWSAPPRFLRKL